MKINKEVGLAHGKDHVPAAGLTPPPTHTHSIISQLHFVPQMQVLMLRLWFSLSSVSSAPFNCHHIVQSLSTSCLQITFGSTSDSGTEVLLQLFLCQSGAIFEKMHIR